MSERKSSNGSFIKGMGLGTLTSLVIITGILVVERVHRGVPNTNRTIVLNSAVPSLNSGIDITVSDTPAPSNAEFIGTIPQTKAQILEWKSQKIEAESIKPKILDRSISYFANQMKLDKDKEKELRARIFYLTSEEYKQKATVNTGCQNSNPNYPYEIDAYEMSVPDDSIYINDGFHPGWHMEIQDVLFSYLKSLYNLLPERRHYPLGIARSANGAVVEYEKGLVMLAKPPGFISSLTTPADCYLLYRYPLQAAFTGDAAQLDLQRLNLHTTAPYPNEREAINFRKSVVLPHLGGKLDSIMEPFLQTTSGEFYRRVGKTLTSSSDPIEQQKAADKLFTQTGLYSAN